MHEYNPYVRKIKDKKRYLKKVFLAGKSVGNERVTNYDQPIKVICKETFIAKCIPYLDLKIQCDTYEKACSTICRLQQRDSRFFTTTVGVFECTYADGDVQYIITKVCKDIERGKQFSQDDIVARDVRHIFAKVERADLHRLDNYDKLGALHCQSKVLGKKEWVGNNRQDANVELAEVVKMCNNDIELCEDIDVDCVCNSDNKYLHRKYGEYIY